jgi:hypothetical protein
MFLNQDGPHVIPLKLWQPHATTLQSTKYCSYWTQTKFDCYVFDWLDVVICKYGMVKAIRILAELLEGTEWVVAFVVIIT